MEPDLDIRLLRAFVTVSETGTVSRAADRLARTQAAVSMQLQRLEAEVGAQFLRRSPRGVSLTEAGEILLAYARKTIALGEDARRQIAGRKLVGRVRLGIVEDLAITRLPSIIADFRRRHPLVEIDLTSASSAELSRALLDGRCDVVMADPARFAKAPKAHLSRQLVWCASRMLELDPQSELPLDHVRRLVLLAGPHAGIAGRGRHRMADRGRASTFAALIAALRAGLGVGLLLGKACLPTARMCKAAMGCLQRRPPTSASFLPITLPCWSQSWPPSSRRVSNSRVSWLD